MNAADKYVVSVMIADRPGVLYGITSAISGMGANIDDISQTVVEGYFSVILTAAFPSPVPAEEITSSVESNFDDALSISVQPFEGDENKSTASGGERYVMVVAGEDGPGILRKTTGFLADRGINIEDWSCNFDGASVIYIGAVTVPSGIDVKQLQVDLSREMAAIGMQATIRHENIFRATNEVGPIKALLK